MTVNGYTSHNYAAQINNATVIVKAYKRENAVAYLQSKDSSLSDADVYQYEGITSSTPVDEVYSELVREQNAKGDMESQDVYKVRMKEEYAHLAQ